MLFRSIAPVVQALAGSTLVVDCTVEGLMHAPELPAILKGGARVIYVSNEHPEALARLLPDDAVESRVKEHVKRLRAAKQMRVTSAAGTDLTISLQGAVAGYKEINLRAIKLLNPGGHLITCSCSYNVDEAMFAEAVFAASSDAHIPVTVVEKRMQGRDHPVLLGVPETYYLKSFILRKLA